MNKGDISSFFRRLGLIYYIDLARYNFHRLKNKSKNNFFRKQNPQVKLPPDYLVYESFGLDYDKYFNGGKEVAIWLKKHFEKHKKLHALNILDWGCGPARVIRHFPEVINNNCSFFGTDYNRDSIEWCKKNIPNVHFSPNDLKPPLPFENETFDIIYGISIFTHLSEQLHLEWLNELLRVSKKGSIIFFTTHGNVFKQILTHAEVNQFDKGKLIVRDNVKEGHRVFGAFHPPSFIENLFTNTAYQNSILEYIPGKISNGGKPEQDIWIIQKE